MGVGAILIAGLVFFVWRRRRHRQAQPWTYGDHTDSTIYAKHGAPAMYFPQTAMGAESPEAHARAEPPSELDATKMAELQGSQLSQGDVPKETSR